jgi:hypothetical protein
VGTTADKFIQLYDRCIFTRHEVVTRLVQAAADEPPEANASALTG